MFIIGPPSITLQPSQTVYALVGQRVSLECTAEGDPTPSVYWIEPSEPRRGDLAPDGLGYDVYEGSAILDITNVGREDQGYYTCVATNSGGRTEDSLQLIGRLWHNSKLLQFSMSIIRHNSCLNEDKPY